MTDNNFLFSQTICYVNGEGKKGKVIAISEYVDRRRVCFLFKGATIGQWFPESSLFVNDAHIESPESQDIASSKVDIQTKNKTNKKEILKSSINDTFLKSLNNQEGNDFVPTREQVQAIIKESGSNLVTLNEAITKKIIVNWEVIVKLAQGTHNSITKAIQTIILPLSEPNSKQVIEAIKETNAQITKEADEQDWYDKKERYIQEFISNYFHAQGVENRIEVRMDNGQKRADVVAPSISLVIEVKRILDERTLWGAVHQVEAYAHKLGMRYSIVVGLPPQDLRKYELAKQEAKRLEKWNSKVIFLDSSSETLGLEKHFQETPPDSLVTNLLVFIRQLREAIMAYIEAISKTTIELLRNEKQQPMLPQS